VAWNLFSRPVLAIVATGALAVAGLAGCSSGGSGTVSSPTAPAQPQSTPGQSTPSQSAPSTQPGTQESSVPVAPLKQSKFYYLTKLSQAELCGLLHGNEPAQIFGSPTGPATFANTLGLGIVCTWSKSGGTGELYIGISTLFSWRDAQPIDKFAGDKPTTIDGHPADAGGPNSKVPYATVHVAVAGLNDPAVELRAPTLAVALKLAQTVLPRLLAIPATG